MGWAGPAYATAASSVYHADAPADRSSKIKAELIPHLSARMQPTVDRTQKKSGPNEGRLKEEVQKLSLRLVEPVVHTNKYGALGGFRTDATSADASAGSSNCSSGVRPEVHVIALQERRPMRHEHPFHAPADGPTRPSRRSLSDLNASKRDIRTRMAPCGAALEVNHPVRHPRVTDAARERVEPLVIEVDYISGERTRSYSSATIITRTVEHVAKAEDPGLGELIITPDLTAAGKARTVGRNGAGRSTEAGVTESSANIAAHVATRPRRHRCRSHHLHGRWCPSHSYICCHCAGRTEGCQGDCRHQHTS